MAHLVRYEVHAGQRYRVVQIGRGFLLTFTLRDGNGLLLDSQEWLYATREAAETGFGFVVAMNAWWDAVTSGYPADDLAETCEAAACEHARAIARLDDKPLTGAAVLAFRRRGEGDDQGDGAPAEARPSKRDPDAGATGAGIAAMTRASASTPS